MSKSKPDPLAWISPPLRAFAVPIAELTPDPGNARRHPTYNLEAIGRSLERFGQQKPIVCSADRIVRCGNGTMAAALAAGRTMIAAVISDLSPAEIEAYAIADNRSGELAEWDPEKLKAALGRMPADLQAAAGWDGDALRRALKMPAVEDEPPAAPSAPISRPGDLWIMGGHRLLCGDSTSAEDSARVLDGSVADTVTDPPYGIGYEYASHEDKPDGNGQLVRGVFKNAPGAKIWTPGLMNLARELREHPAAKVCCWHKGFAQAGNGLGGASTWEPVLCLGVSGGRLANDYLHFPTDREPGLRDDHPCPKPVKLFVHLIDSLTDRGVYEPFSGSGTTLIACEQLKRRCFAIEIDPRYVDVAVNRWEALTGQRAALEDGTDPRTAPR